MANRVKSSSAYQSKYKFEIEKLKNIKAKEMIQQFRIFFQNSDHLDVQVKLEEDIICYNKCILFSLVPDIKQLLNEASAEDIIHIPNKDLKGCKGKVTALYSAILPVDSIESPFLITSEFAKLIESEMYSDVTLELQDGKQFQCHKGVLAARTQYFNTMFYGAWKESSDTIIKLLNFSSSVFESVLNFIYTANPELPQDIDVVDLLIAQDMLNVEGFHGVIKHHLKAHYCHFFHQPCESCLETETV